jgi:MerR family mercuric resistance operon transcriptional regulator
MENLNEMHYPVGIGKLSAITGCSPETIRYYEQQELLPEAGRSMGGHRQYGENQLKLLQFILRAKHLGFSQPDVRRLLKMADPAKTDCNQVHHMATHQLVEVQNKLRNLRNLEKTLKGLIKNCEAGGGDMDCPMIDSLLDEV